MGEIFLKLLPIYLLSMLKVVFGPVMGYAAGLHMFLTMAVTFAGMMTSVLLITYFGDLLKRGFLKNWFERQQARAATSKWRKYGLPWIAILTPLLLTPIGGTIVAVGGAYPRSRIIFYMSLTAGAFAVLATLVIYTFGPTILPDFAKWWPF